MTALPVMATLLLLMLMPLRMQAQAGGAAAAAPATAVPVAPVTAPTTTATSPGQGSQGNGTQAGQGGNGRTAATDQAARDAANPERGSTAPAFTQEPLTEFQQLVASSLGRTLPIFGSSLFAGVPSTFAPVADVPVSAEYILGPGDEVAIQITGQVSRQFDLTVDRTGNLQVPELGTVHVAGVPYGQLGTYLQGQFGKIYRNFTLSTNLGSLRTIQVFVVGEARRPGTYTISSLSTLLNAIFASGGPLPDGSLRDIQVRRNGKTLVHFDLYDLLLHGDKTNDIRLLSGDVIFIPFTGPQVAVAGSVNSPAIYELKGPTPIVDALTLAGGTTAIAGGSDVRLERVYEHSMRSVEDVHLATAGNQVLQNGDIVSVTSIVERFRNAITLRGNVANPGRYVWHPGMRLSDLIPNKAALITRNYWNRQNQLGQFVQDYLPNTSISTQTGALGLRANQQVLESVVPPPDPGTAASGNAQVANTSRNNGGVEAGGNSVGTALTGSNSNFSAQTDVVLSAPDIDWSYAVIERLSAQDLKTSLIPFNLGKLVLDGDASQNLELQPNDVVTIFSTADIRVPTTQQTRYVRLEGEFIAPGVYSVLPGETLRGLLRRAGGFTPEAYLYASEFTRASTQRVEAQRLQEYADQLDAQISSTTANNTARAISASDQTAATVSATDARGAVARLRRVVPSGRLVLDLRPDSAGVDAVPDLALEDGDRFVVPRVPASVTVEGQVYNANAFVYQPNSHVADYLRRAGGPDRQADKRREFILRADGSVISEQYSNVKRAPVFPGDTLVVPPVIDRRAIFQRIVDLAGVASNIGITAATLAILARD